MKSDENERKITSKLVECLQEYRPRLQIRTSQHENNDAHNCQCTDSWPKI